MGRAPAHGPAKQDHGAALRVGASAEAQAVHVQHHVAVVEGREEVAAVAPAGAHEALSRTRRDAGRRAHRHGHRRLHERQRSGRAVG